MSDTDNTERLKGVVKWFNDAKGFGFIEHGSGRDVFVHYSVIVQEGFKTLEDGEEVEYEVQEGPKGLHAVRVSRTKIAEQVAADASEAEALVAAAATANAEATAESATQSENS